MIEAGERCFYIDDYTDEIMPCDSTLQGWADWLSKPDKVWSRDRAAADGSVFQASAMVLKEDIVATRNDGVWTISREPEEGDFVAVRLAKGKGWFPENIIFSDHECLLEGGEKTESMGSALLSWLRENDDACDDTEYVAVGTGENDWKITYHATGPKCTAERVN